jgi:hypothetical protein
MTSRASQRERILELLVAAHGNWVPLPSVQACGAQYNARIFELRRGGFRIVNRIREVNGQRHSWFRLESVPTPEPRPLKTDRGDVTLLTPGIFPQFGRLEPERYGPA